MAGKYEAPRRRRGPIPILLLLPLWFGLNGVLFAGPIADGLAALLSLTMVTINFRGLTDKEQEKQEKTA